MSVYLCLYFHIIHFGSHINIGLFKQIYLGMYNVLYMSEVKFLRRCPNMLKAPKGRQQ